MSKRQLTALFLCSLVPWTVGMGMLPLLPVVAVRLGADSTAAGLYLASAHGAVGLGAISGGWVSGSRYRRRLPLIVLGLAGVPLTWLTGQVNSVWALALLTAILWFCLGLELSLLGILAGVCAGENERGKVFGILELTYGLGAAAGGLGTGWLADNWGYSAMFSGLAVFSLSLPLTAWFLEEKEDQERQCEEHLPTRPARLGRSYYLLCAASIMTYTTFGFIMLIRSLMMDNLGFGSLEIASTGVVGGLICLPLPVLLGWLSDRTGRKSLLVLGYVSAFPALIVLAFSTAIWHFWLVFVFVGLVPAGNASIGYAWVTDLIPRESLGKGLAFYGSTPYLAEIIGYGVSGYALQNLGVTPTLVIGGLLALGAVGLLIPIKAKVGQVRLSKA